MGLVPSARLFVPLLVAFGFIADLYRPAASAIIGDLLPSSERASGFAGLRMAVNLGWAAGTALGGLLADWDWRLLFLGDGLTTLAYGVARLLRDPRDAARWPRRRAHRRPSRGLGPGARPGHRASAAADRRTRCATASSWRPRRHGLPLHARSSARNLSVLPLTVTQSAGLPGAWSSALLAAVNGVLDRVLRDLDRRRGSSASGGSALAALGYLPRAARLRHDRPRDALGLVPARGPRLHRRRDPRLAAADGLRRRLGAARGPRPLPEPLPGHLVDRLRREPRDHAAAARRPRRARVLGPDAARGAARRRSCCCGSTGRRIGHRDYGGCRRLRRPGSNHPDCSIELVCGRDAGCPAPPAQIPARGITALGSCLRSEGRGAASGQGCTMRTGGSQRRRSAACAPR